MTAVMRGDGVAEAASLARRGRHERARELLDGLGGETSDDPVLLDLLARVHAQRGDLAAADRCWARALEVGGDVPSARE
ncbi:MAG: flagellar motor protein MotB, partial [Saccharothrix sp.]|nr:flagellar motor protein MotB [Saccharothrix sp.]